MLGNDDGSPTKGVTGGSLPAQLWKRVMVRALDGVPPRVPPEQPPRLRLSGLEPFELVA